MPANDVLKSLIIREAEQLTLALRRERAEGLVFRMALEAEASSDVQRVVFLALRGEEGQVECLSSVPLNDPQEQSVVPMQLMLLGEDAEQRVVRVTRRSA